MLPSGLTAVHIEIIDIDRTPRHQSVLVARGVRCLCCQDNSSFGVTVLFIIIVVKKYFTKAGLCYIYYIYYRINFFFFNSACLSVCRSIFFCLPACLPACLPVCLPACLTACLPAYQPACLPTCLPVFCQISFSLETQDFYY